MVKTSGKNISKGNNKNQEEILSILLVICIVKGATKSYFTHYLRVVIFFDAHLSKSAFSTFHFQKLVFYLFVFNLCFLFFMSF